VRFLLFCESYLLVAVYKFSPLYAYKYIANVHIDIGQC